MKKLLCKLLRLFRGNKRLEPFSIEWLKISLENARRKERAELEEILLKESLERLLWDVKVHAAINSQWKPMFSTERFQEALRK